MAVNVVQSALSSRRFNQWLPWAAGLLLVAGVIAFMVAYFGNTANPAKDIEKVRRAYEGERPAQFA